jgi:hypothetical protein
MVSENFQTTGCTISDRWPNKGLLLSCTARCESCTGFGSHDVILIAVGHLKCIATTG